MFITLADFGFRWGNVPTQTPTPTRNPTTTWGVVTRGIRGGCGGATQYVRGNYTSFKGTNLMVVEEMHQIISPDWFCLIF